MYQGAVIRQPSIIKSSMKHQQEILPQAKLYTHRNTSTVWSNPKRYCGNTLVGLAEVTAASWDFLTQGKTDHSIH